MVNKKVIFFIIFISAVLGMVFFVFNYKKNNLDQEKNNSIKTQEQKILETTYKKDLVITDGLTYGKLMEQAEINTTTSQNIFDAAKDIYNLSKIKVNNNLRLIFDKQTNDLIQLVYQIDSEDELKIIKNASSSQEQWQAWRQPIPYVTKIKSVWGAIETSMYEAALAQGIDERAVIGFADAFEWTIDFAWEVRKGDMFKFIYEERYLEDKYIGPGKVLSGKFINDGKTYYVFYYQGPDGKIGYYDQDGNSAQKMFLKAPLAFKYISSPFTTGKRYIKAFNVSTGHRAVDYAATYGTPIRSVGDGTIVLAGWNGPYGQMVSVRHNSTYQTNYGHMSKIAVKRGQKVTQSQTIGYVGSTGFSTGPHLHYEMIKNGTKINPLKEVLPPTPGISKTDMPVYQQAIKDLKNQLDN